MNAAQRLTYFTAYSLVPAVSLNSCHRLHLLQTPTRGDKSLGCKGSDWKTCHLRRDFLSQQVEVGQQSSWGRAAWGSAEQQSGRGGERGAEGQGAGPRPSTPPALGPRPEFYAPQATVPTA